MSRAERLCVTLRLDYSYLEKVDLSQAVRVARNRHFTLVRGAALIGNVPITGLSIRNNSAICGAILSSHIGRGAVSYFHLEFSFSSRSGQHDERRDLLHYTCSFYRGW